MAERGIDLFVDRLGSSQWGKTYYLASESADTLSLHELDSPVQL
jgi:hypothetical protein